LISAAFHALSEKLRKLISAPRRRALLEAHGKIRINVETRKSRRRKKL
jgi:hypothetical protein